MKYWNSSKWHLLAFVFTFIYTCLCNSYNFMYLKELYAGQLFICAFITFCVAFAVELYQMTKGANSNEQEWNDNAKPDIIVSTLAGLVGCICAIFIYW